METLSDGKEEIRRCFFFIYDSDKFSGATTRTLRIANVVLSDSYTYRCVDTGTSTYVEETTLIVRGIYGKWNEWTECSATCGQAMRYRNKLCVKPDLSSREMCTNETSQSELCSLSGCPVDGVWGEWSSWSRCSVTCGEGIMISTRECNSPHPTNGGKDCSGSHIIESTCQRNGCPIDGNWTSWSEWSSCTTSCGGGNTTRERSCTSPFPQNGGKGCTGSESEHSSCLIKKCQAESITDDNNQSVALGGAIGAVVLVLIVVVFIVWILRKRTNCPSKKYSKSTTSNRAEPGMNVIFRPDPKMKSQESVYLNIGRESGLSCTDTDDYCRPSTNADHEYSNTDTDYCNVVLEDSPDLSLIDIKELGGHITKREINEGLINEYKALPYGAQYPTTNATTKENMPKNRFKFIFPYDHTRVVLQDGPDFINANYIDGFEKEKCYVACQGPTKTTLGDHWRMIWQLNISRIVMLTNLVEGAKRKCERYWPEEETTTTHGNLVVTLLSVKTRATYITRLMSVENKMTKEKKSIIQYHFISWPDHGTPDPFYLVLFHRHVMLEQSDCSTGPLLVHCSAGIGRTGTYIGLDALYEQGKTTGYIDVVAFVKKMRYCRMNMVQTPEQYVCLHRALHEEFTMKDRNISKHDFGMVWRDIVSDERPTNHQILREEFKMLEEKKQEHANEEYVFATSSENKNKNRNHYVLPADKDRVYLTSFEKGRTDYINAVRVPSYTTLIGFLTTQLPIPDTKVDFWTMVRDQDSSTIVLFLTDHSEADFVYSTSKSTGSLGLNTLKITNTVDEEHGIKVVSITLNKKDTKSKDIIIYQAVCDGLPEADVLCKLTNLMSTRISMIEGPVTVVSSDGASICGLFCTFSNAVSSMTIDENVDIFQLAKLLQLKRPEFFKNFEEYRKVYEAVNFYLESTNVYANF